jgi:hypothetical protein
MGAAAPGNLPGHSAVTTTPQTTHTGTPGSPGSNPTSTSEQDGSSQPGGPPASPNSRREHAEQGAKNASGADDTLLLTALVLVFTVAVSGVVVAAGRRGGHRVH